MTTAPEKNVDSCWNLFRRSWIRSHLCKVPMCRGATRVLFGRHAKSLYICDGVAFDNSIVHIEFQKGSRLHHRASRLIL